MIDAVGEGSDGAGLMFDLVSDVLQSVVPD